jgi:hypothetical protein
MKRSTKIKTLFLDIERALLSIGQSQSTKIRRGHILAGAGHRSGIEQIIYIDASQFNGWENIKAFENHIQFIKTHQPKAERIAVIVGHEWQHWLIGVIRIFVHPAVRDYEKGQEIEALQWIVE